MLEHLDQTVVLKLFTLSHYSIAKILTSGSPDKVCTISELCVLCHPKDFLFFDSKLGIS